MLRIYGVAYESQPDPAGRTTLREAVLDVDGNPVGTETLVPDPVQGGAFPLRVRFGTPVDLQPGQTATVTCVDINAAGQRSEPSVDSFTEPAAEEPPPDTVAPPAPGIVRLFTEPVGP